MDLLKEKYDWSGVYMDWNERYGWHLTKEVTTHAAVENESQNDSATNNQPTPSLQDSNSTI